jgi:hypothetical protein
MIARVTLEPDRGIHVARTGRTDGHVTVMGAPQRAPPDRDTDRVANVDYP